MAITQSIYSSMAIVIVVATDQEHDALALSVKLLGYPVSKEETIENDENGFDVFAGTKDKARIHRQSLTPQKIHRQDQRLHR